MVYQVCIVCDVARAEYQAWSIKFVLCVTSPGPSIEAEGRDRVELDLPGKQLQLLKDAIFFSELLRLIHSHEIVQRHTTFELV